ncbi:type II toxin-antitoxin system VapC family toxin [Acidobacteriota bacterium]
MKKILLDTNAFSRLLGGDETVLDILSESEIVYMSIFVLGELYTGFKAGKKEQRNRSILDNFLKKPTVRILNATTDTAEVFAFVKSNLRKAGKPIPINDVWIASHAIETGSALVSYDKHFKDVSGLLLREIA